MSNKETIIHLKLGKESLARLDALKQTTEAYTYEEILKQALRLYEFVVQTEESGCTLLAQQPDGSTRPMPVF